MEDKKTKGQEKKVKIRKAVITERRKLFKWLTDSSITPSIMGPPLYPDAPLPTWEEFIEDYSDTFFKNTADNTGRCFIIEVNKKDIGTVSYDLLDRKKKCVVLDIWLKDEDACGHGYGTEALMILIKHLNETEGIRYFYISPSLRNKRAIRAYEKTGFTKLKMNRTQSKKKFGTDILDYEDNVVMRIVNVTYNRRGKQGRQV